MKTRMFNSISSRGVTTVEKDVYLFSAAIYGKLNQVPREILTSRNLLAKDRFGNTPLHYAAEFGYLEQVPREVKTTENLLTKGKDDENVFHKAAWFGHLNQIPDELLTEDNLFTKNKEGKTPLYMAVERGHYHQIYFANTIRPKACVPYFKELMEAYNKMVDLTPYERTFQIKLPLLEDLVFATAHEERRLRKGKDKRKEVVEMEIE
jgi:hypothetical protein